MKYIKFFLTLFLINCNNPCFSQNEGKSEFKFRLGFSNTANNPTIWQFYENGKHTRINSLYLGFSYSISLNEKNALMVGAAIANKGYKTTALKIQPDFTVELSYRYDLNYLEIPLTYIYKANYCDVYLGVNYSYLMRASWNAYLYEAIRNGRTTEFIYNSEITDLMKRNDWGIHIGFSKKITPFLGVELILQENFIDPYKITQEIAKQQTLFVGLQYYIY
jgi:hypothetical protein